MALEKLTAAFILKVLRNPKENVGRHADGGGLYLEVTDSGGIYWRYKYRIQGFGKDGQPKLVERLYAIGTLEEKDASQARDEHRRAHDLVDKGIDPTEEKRKQKAAKAVERSVNRPFHEVASEWMDELIKPHFGARTIYRYELNLKVLNEAFGNLAISTIELPHLSTVLLKYQRAEKYETRRRIQQAALNVMGMAVSRGYIKVNPFIGVTLGSGYTSPETVRESRPALIDPAGFGRVLRDIERAPQLIRLALRLLALVFVRPGELAQLEWKRDIDWKAAKLTVPFSIQKMRTERLKKKSSRAGKDFEVPLSRQAIVVLQELYQLTGEGRYLFPALSGKNKEPFIGEATINSALNRLDYQGIHCAHGFRSSASTMLNAERITVRTVDGEEVETERWVQQKALIEVQLDHDDASTQAIYDRGGRWSERKQIMQFWADRIDQMRGNEEARLLSLAA